MRGHGALYMLIHGHDIDRLLNWPSGRAERLARRNKLPHYKLPDGEIRFKRDEIFSLITPAGPLPPASALLSQLPDAAQSREAQL